MKVYRHLSQIVTLKSAFDKDGRHLLPADLSLIQNGAIAFNDDKILWVGEDHDLPREYQALNSFNGTGFVLTPGLVDSHTHLVFAGNRAREYSDRLNGADYQAIAQNGGGILHTMTKTLAASEDELFQLGVERLDRMLSYGIKTVELKSGYALTREGELRLLQVAARLKKHFRTKLTLVSTYMGAHAVPATYKSSEDFVTKVVLPAMQEGHAQGLIDCVDVFHEHGYFSTQDVERIFATAHSLDLPFKIHADEFQDNHGAALAAKHGALSADHLLKASTAGISALAQSQTVATLLPGTAFFLGKELPRARAMLDAGCKVAIASDYNPGSSHVDNLLLVASIAAPSLKLNQAELWSAMTLNAAAALGLKDRGALAPGLVPSFSLFKANDLSEITYNWGVSLSRPLP
jgi:imidazolonepropionase